MPSFVCTHPCRCPVSDPDLRYLNARSSYPEGKKIVEESPELFEVLKKDAARSFLRGVNGQLYEMLNAETTQRWPDPRRIQTKAVAL